LVLLLSIPTGLEVKSLCKNRNKQNENIKRVPAKPGLFHFMTSQKLKIGIQGISTCFHEVAARTYFHDSIEPVECLTFDKLCESLKKKECDFAMMAIENTIAGSILPNYFLLQEFRFSIVGEIYLPIHLHLLAFPGVKLEDIKTVESHPMAIRQCFEYLHKLNGVELRESDDTAISARKVAEKKLKATGAIANELAAKRFGLEILGRRIETHKKNFTRFLVLARNGDSKDESNKASLSFEVFNEVGSLADVLTVFKNNQINLSKIQSIPVIGKPQEYSIHVDVEWNERKNYDDALKQIQKQTHNLSVLGEYKKGKIEYK
jgi:prephenate dehydratase